MKNGHFLALKNPCDFGNVYHIMQMSTLPNKH